MAECSGFHAVVHTKLSVDAPDESLDLVFAWSVFTHRMQEETLIYMEDIYRALKPGGRLAFSFLEFGQGNQWAVFLYLRCSA